MADKPKWSVWAGGRRTWKRDVAVMIFLRCNAPRDRHGKIVVPDDDVKRPDSYKSEQLVWEHRGPDYPGDIVLVRRA